MDEEESGLFYMTVRDGSAWILDNDEKAHRVLPTSGGYDAMLAGLENEGGTGLVNATISPKEGGMDVAYNGVENWGVDIAEIRDKFAVAHDGTPSGIVAQARRLAPPLQEGARSLGPAEGVSLFQALKGLSDLERD